MLIGSGEFTYEWVDDWARIPDTESSRSGWAHPGVVVSETALVATFHQADPTVLLFEPDGSLNRSWTADVTNGHGMTLVEEGASEFIWFADEVSAAVIKTDLDGKTVMSIDKPDLPIYENDGDYSPTSVTVFEKKDGGAGDVWVSDGYGQSYVHRHTENGEYVGSVNGEEGDSGGSLVRTESSWIPARPNPSCISPTAATTASRSTTWRATTNGGLGKTS